MIYICYIIYKHYVITCVLTVGDDELAVRDNDDASSGVAEGRHVQEVSESSRERTSGVVRQSSSVITNRMIYICYIICWDNVATCVLVVRDNELSVKDDDDASSVAAEGRARAGRHGEGHADGLRE